MKDDRENLNCWEYNHCSGRGECKDEKGCNNCPAYLEHRVNGMNGGINGGRICWFIDGTHCDNSLRIDSGKSYVEKFKVCLKCDFNKYVEKQEGRKLVSIYEVFAKLRN
ncbi:two-CW domain-containing protein [Thermodesulfobacteriota bacterium]